MYTWIEIPENELKEMFMNYSVTAEKMYVHINTIRKKIDKVNDLVKIEDGDFIAVFGIGGVKILIFVEKVSHLRKNGHVRSR